MVQMMTHCLLCQLASDEGMLVVCLNTVVGIEQGQQGLRELVHLIFILIPSDLDALRYHKVNMQGMRSQVIGGNSLIDC